MTSAALLGGSSWRNRIVLGGLWALVAGVVGAVTIAAFVEFLGEPSRDLLLEQGPLSLRPEVAEELGFFFGAEFLRGAQAIVHIVGMVVFALIAIGLAVRSDGDWVKVLTSAMLLAVGGALFAPSSLLSEIRPGWDTAVEAVGVLAPGPELWRSLAGVGVVLFAFVFPDGRLVPRAAALPLAVFLGHVAVWSVFPSSPLDPGRWPSPLTVAWTLAPALAIPGAQIYRYVAVSSPERRAQTRLVVLALTASMATFVLLWAVDPRLDAGVFELVVATRRLSALYDLNILILLTAALMLLPAAITVSVVRYRLWNIDLLLNRALVYAVLTGIVAVAFFIGLVGVGSLLTRTVAGGRGVAGVITGVVMVVVFQPVRRRVQAGVDRRFYRSKYDAEKVLDGLARDIGDMVGTEAVENRLISALDRALHPSRARLLIPGREERVDDELAASLLATPNQPVPASGSLAADGVVVVPFVAQADLVGVLVVGERRSGRPYSAIDRSLLSRLASIGAPALRIALLVEEQERQLQERMRFESEMEVARRIQRDLLPHHLPEIDGWEFHAAYEPARQVGGDFYDVIALAGGRYALLVADVSGKGVPAAMVMATCRTLIRGAAAETETPGDLLAAVNRRLVPDVTPGMFVTCFYAVLDPVSGRLDFANAGHTLPVLRRSGGTVLELRATGMPLGWMAEADYEPGSVFLDPGDAVLLLSDGVVEAHSPAGEMFGSSRLGALLDRGLPGNAPERVIAAVHEHVGPEGDVGDDVTLLAVIRVPEPPGRLIQLTSFTVAAEPGAERRAADAVDVAVAGRIDDRRRSSLHSAVAEAVMNAVEHGGSGVGGTPISVEVLTGRRNLIVRITDKGRGVQGEVAPPDLEAKLRGDEPPRGWGLFLMERLVDEVRRTVTPAGHTVELLVSTE